MKKYFSGPIMALVLTCATPGLALAQATDINEVVSAGNIAPKLELTPSQRNAIYQEVRRDRSKLAPSKFETHVGGDVPPMIELYMLPDDILANNPVTKLYKFTTVDDEVVLVDPTNMRVIAVIGPKPAD